MHEAAKRSDLHRPLIPKRLSSRSRLAPALHLALCSMLMTDLREPRVPLERLKSKMTNQTEGGTCQTGVAMSREFRARMTLPLSKVAEVTGNSRVLAPSACLWQNRKVP